MRYTSLSLAFAIIFSFFIIQPPAAQAIPNKDTIKTQGDLCLWLLFELGAQGPQGEGPGQAVVGPGVNGERACDFFKRSIGIYPEDGWKWNEPLKRDELAGICLGYNPKADLESNVKTTEAIVPSQSPSSKETAEKIQKLLDNGDDDRAKFKELLELIEECIKQRYTFEERSTWRINPSPSL